jgi:hypothetical protein
MLVLHTDDLADAARFCDLPAGDGAEAIAGAGAASRSAGAIARWAKSEALGIQYHAQTAKNVKPKTTAMATVTM